MKYLGILLTYILCLFTACDVHEWPTVPEEPPVTPDNPTPEPEPEPEKPVLCIKLDFQTDIDQKEISYDSRATGSTTGYDMRYTLRAFAVDSENRSVSRTAAWEYTFTRSVSLYDYDCEVKVDFPEGEYNLMVWADFVKAGTTGHHFYNPDTFAEITLHGAPQANNDFKDTFRGIESMQYVKKEGETVQVVKMLRPLAKFEFVTTDLKEFINKETAKQRSSKVDLSNYRLTFYYNGYMPCAFNMFTDKPNDSKTGVSFESTLTQLNDSEASMGFDYVLVNGTESSVPMVIALKDKKGNTLSVSNPIDVPLKRGQHTVVKGKFLSTQGNSGATIDPNFNGDYNVVLP